jgi:hypothetical protein
MLDGFRCCFISFLVHVIFFFILALPSIGIDDVIFVDVIVLVGFGMVPCTKKIIRCNKLRFKFFKDSLSLFKLTFTCDLIFFDIIIKVTFTCLRPSIY